MKLKIFLLVLIFILSTVFITGEEQNLQPILEKGDVLNFIKTFPQLKDDFKKHKIMYNAKSGTMTYPEAIKANAEFMDILKKHGWDEHFFSKTAAICLGYSSVVYKEELTKADPKLEKSIKEIEDNTALSDTMKKQLIEQLKSVKGVLKSQRDVFKKSVHKADLELVKPHIEALKKVFEHEK